MVLYAVSAVYFAGVMVRLMLTLTPIVCILASIAISHSLDNYMKPVFSSKDGELIDPFQSVNQGNKELVPNLIFCALKAGQLTNFRTPSKVS